MLAGETFFTVEELRELAGRASSIDERLSGGFVAKVTTEAAEKASKRLETWRWIAGDGDDALFRKRLGRDDLGIDVITPLLGDVRIAEGQPTPKWVETFSWAVEAMRRLGESDRLGRFLKTDQRLPFEDLLAPVVTYAQERRDQLTGAASSLLSESAHTALERDFLGRLCELCAPTLYEGFKLHQMLEQPWTTLLAVSSPGDPLSRRTYDSYVAAMRADGLSEFFLNRPVLARLLATVTEAWIETTAEFIGRLDSDLVAITKTLHSGVELGPVTDMDCGLSDPHNGRRTVSILTFSSGLKVVYKPKDLGLDVAWRELLCWLEVHGAPQSARAPIVLERKGYGWVEWIDSRPCADEAEARRFFRRAGSMLCLMHLLQGTDFHYENVIADGDQPVAVDLETLMHPWFVRAPSAHGPQSAIAAATESLRASVLATGYLPEWVVGPGFELAGIGGINPAELDAHTQWKFLHVNTDGMTLEKVPEVSEPELHLPTLKGQKLSCSMYSQEFVDGFKAMYSFLLDRRSEMADPSGPLAPFRGQIVRVLLRPTQVYAMLLRRSQENQNLSDGIDWSLQFDLLSRYTNWDDEDDPLWPAQLAERSALARMDIPFFTTNTGSGGLSIPGAGIIQRCFEGPSFNQTISRLLGLDQTGLQTQLLIIQHAIKNAAINVSAGGNQPWRNTSKTRTGDSLLVPDFAVERARALAAILEREAVCADGGATWIGAVPLPGEERAQLKVIGYDLYSGASGIALFLAALRRITREARYHDLALAALAPFRAELRGAESGPRLTRIMGIGAGAGLGSVIYALVRSAALLDEPALLEDASYTASLITDERIARDRRPDVIFGAAGAILGLLALYRASRDEFALDRAVACGRHLLAKQEHNEARRAGWKISGDTPLTGFSHGAAGIALALLRLYKATKTPEFLSAARRGINYERGEFSDQAGNWPDLRVVSHTKRGVRYLCQWCHGATGIGLARLGALDTLDDQQVRREIDVALKRTIEFPMAPLDHLCCGNFGRLETLFTSGQRLGQRKLISLAHERAIHLLQRASTNGGFFWPSGTDAQNPGFFCGVSGIGYQLLRFTFPEKLPCILLWE